MKKISIPIPTVPDVLSGLKRRMGQLVPSQEDAPPGEPQSPFDKYYRDKLLKNLNLKEVEGNSILEVGCGIGDLLKMAAQYRPKEIFGVDNELEALEVARNYLSDIDCDLSLACIDKLPFPDQSFDYVFAVFEMQYLPDGNLEAAVNEICRVSRQWVILVEETAMEKEEEEGIIYRPIQTYKSSFRKFAFHLRETKYLDVAFSRTIFRNKRSPWLWVRWVFSPLLFLMGFPASWMNFPSGKEEEVPTNKFALFLQKLTLPLTSGLDDVFTAGKGVAIMRFERERLFRRG